MNDNNNFEDILKVFNQQIIELPGKYGYYRNDLFVLVDNIKTVLEISKSYQYKDLSANGFCSFAKFSISFLLFILQPNNMDKLEYDHVKKMLDLIKKNYNILLYLNELKEKSHTNVNDKTHENTPTKLFFPFNTISHTYQEIFCTISESKCVMRYFSNIWLSPKSRFWLNNLLTIASLFNNMPKSLNPKKQKSDADEAFLKDSTILIPHYLLDLIDSQVSRFVLRNIIYFKRNAFGKRLIIKPQTRWRIPADSRNIIDNKCNNNNTENKENIKLRYILHRKKQLNTKLLIIYYHGSGFICTRTEFYDTNLLEYFSKKCLYYHKIKVKNCSIFSPEFLLVLEIALPLNDRSLFRYRTFLVIGDPSRSLSEFDTLLPLSNLLAISGNFQKKLISRSRGVAALVVDYSLKVAFPKQFQECFDAYLWATSGEPEVKEKLGFNPTDIIIISDSAGSIMALTILFLIAQIQKLDPKYHTFLPKAFISLYGVYNITFDWCPSRFLSEFDTLLPLSILLAISGVLMDEQGTMDKLNSNKNDQSSLQSDSKKCGKNNTPIMLPWYKDGDKLNIDKIQSLHEKFSSSFMNTIKCNFDSISSVHLYLMTTHYCPFLDDNITIAKLWKGSIEVDVVDNMPHEFMIMPVEKKYKNHVFTKILKIIDNVLKTN